MKKAYYQLMTDAVEQSGNGELVIWVKFHNGNPQKQSNDKVRYHNPIALVDLYEEHSSVLLAHSVTSVARTNV
jgi:hypothetical protein